MGNVIKNNIPKAQWKWLNNPYVVRTKWGRLYTVIVEYPQNGLLLATPTDTTIFETEEVLSCNDILGIVEE